MYEDDFEDEGSGLLKDLRKQLKALQKERDDLAAKAAEAEKANKARSIQEVLTSKGANPKLAKFILADGVDDEAGAEAWLAENGELFGFQPKAAEPAVEEDDLAAMQQVQQATSTGQVLDLNRLSQQSQFMDEAQTPAEWMARANALKAGQVNPNFEA